MTAYYAVGACDAVAAAVVVGAVAYINSVTVVDIVAAADGGGGDVPEPRNDGNGECAAAAGDVTKEVTLSNGDLRTVALKHLQRPYAEGQLNELYDVVVVVAAAGVVVVVATVLRLDDDVVVVMYCSTGWRHQGSLRSPLFCYPPETDPTRASYCSVRS